MCKFKVEESPKTFAYVIERDTFKMKCNRCGFPLLRTDIPEKGYTYQCLNCDEDLYETEAHEGEFHTDEEFMELCETARDILLLDEEVE